MNDDDLDRLLAQRGEQWRDAHERVADFDVQRLARRASRTTATRWVPVVAAAAVLGVLAAVLVVRPASHRAPAKPIGGPSPATSTSSQPPLHDRSVPLAHTGVAVDYLGDGRLVLSLNAFHPGARSSLEVRPVDRPSVVTYSIRSSWLKGGDLSCPTLHGDWLVYTDVEDVPSLRAPGPPQPWKLAARNIATGEQRVLDTGVADMGTEFACAVRDGDRLAWTSGRATETTLLDIRTGVRRRLMLSGTPVGFARAGLVVASTAVGPRTTTELVDPGTGSHRQIAVLDGDDVQASGDYLAWYERTSSDGSSGLLHACRLPACPGGSAHNHAATALDQVPGDTPQTAIGADYVAWTVQDDTVTVRWLDGHGVPLTVDGYVQTLHADGSRLAFVARSDFGTPQEKDVLHLVQVTG